jgi:hypothetical protein
MASGINGRVQGIFLCTRPLGCGQVTASLAVIPTVAVVSPEGGTSCAWIWVVS